MRLLMIGLFALAAGAAHADGTQGKMVALPKLTLETQEDQKLGQDLVDALSAFSTKVTVCAEAIKPDAPEDASEACVCQFPDQRKKLVLKLAEVEERRPAWIGHIIHVTSPRDGQPTSLALPHLRAQVDSLTCD